jgi:tRNA(Ile)-lysidine synthase
VLERVTATARAHDMFAPGDLVLVAVSGGPDSVCLLHALHRLRRLFRIRLAVFHFDHRLRPDSGKDAEYVRRMANRLALPFHLREAAARPPKGASMEMWGRWARTEGMTSVGAEIGATKFADGHTVDDQAETVLMALVLGWGPDGLSGIHPVNGMLVRPLLDVTREEVEAFCRALGLRPRRDPTNRDVRLLRNALRLKALPAIERATGREVKRTFAQTADLVREDTAELFREATRVANDLVHVDKEAVSMPVEGLRALAPALARRVVRRAFQMGGFGWTRESIQAVLDLAEGRPGRRRDLPGGLKADRDTGYVRVARASPE